MNAYSLHIYVHKVGLKTNIYLERRINLKLYVNLKYIYIKLYSTNLYAQIVPILDKQLIQSEIISRLHNRFVNYCEIINGH